MERSDHLQGLTAGARFSGALDASQTTPDDTAHDNHFFDDGLDVGDAEDVEDEDGEDEEGGEEEMARVLGDTGVMLK